MENKNHPLPVLSQVTDQVLMIRPACFGFNEETAVNNAFQQNSASVSPEEIQHRAMVEFDALAHVLVTHGISVHILNDTPDPAKPDAIFPNNWVTLHHSGLVVTYPMFSPLRRRERRPDLLSFLTNKGFVAGERLRLEQYETEGKFLEGTGSIVFDHRHRLACACLSPRTNKELLADLCEVLQYEPVVFRAMDAEGADIYHTNVMLSIGSRFAIVCLEAVPDKKEREMLFSVLAKTKETVIEIGLEQMSAFAANVLLLGNGNGDEHLIMSTSAFNALKPEQRSVLSSCARLLHSPLDTIETYGGGSARCMIAEIFLPLKKDF